MLNETTKYIANRNTWFKEGTECTLVEEYDGCDFGLFRGIYIISDTEYDEFWYNQGYSIGDEVMMNEVCLFNEFNIQ